MQLIFSPRRQVTVEQMKVWAFRASRLTPGQCEEAEKLVEYMRRIERDNRRYS